MRRSPLEQFEVVGVRTSRRTNTGVMMMGTARRRVRMNEVVRVGGNGTRVVREIEKEIANRC